LRGPERDLLDSFFKAGKIVLCPNSPFEQVTFWAEGDFWGSLPKPVAERQKRVKSKSKEKRQAFKPTVS
jgi:hypothetical protein